MTLLACPAIAAAPPSTGDLAGALGAVLERRTAGLEPGPGEEARLAGLLRRGDRDALAATEARLAARHPDVVRAWLLPPGHDRVDYASVPPLGYAALELLRHAEETGRSPGLEAQLLDTEHGHVAFARRLEGPEGALAGHLLYALDPDLVGEALGELPAVEGLVEVRQAVAGAAVSVAARGDAMQAPGTLAPVPGTRWSLRRVTPEEEAALRSREVGGGRVLLLALAGVLVLFLGGLLVLRRRHPPSKPRARPAPKPVVLDEGPTRQPAPSPSLSAAGIEVTEGDGEEEEPAATEGTGEQPAASLPRHIFRAYDIRGLVERDITPERAELVGRAVGTEAGLRDQHSVVVAADGRLSSPALTEALVRGLRAAGRDVILLGRVPTPVAYFAAEYLEARSCVVVTGSHNPPEYNGFKIMLDGQVLAGDEVDAIRRRIESGDLSSGSGELQEMDIGAEYIRRVSEDIPVALGSAYTLVVDCGNAVAGTLAPRLYRALGYDVVELYCEVDGRFPNHHPDPSDPANLQDLVAAVTSQGADLGLAFDGDGDRLGVVDGEGNVIWADQLMMAFAESVLASSPGSPVVFDVKCSRRLGEVISRAGGKAVMSRSGHSMMRQAMAQAEAPLAGELSGHIFFKDRWYGFDDALYAGARLLEILQQQDRSPAAFFAQYRTGLTTPELRVPMAEGEAHQLMAGLPAERISGTRATTVDGLRLDYADGWGLVRASNTTPSLVFRFEADDAAGLSRIQDDFRKLVHARRADLELPF